MANVKPAGPPPTIKMSVNLAADLIVLAPQMASMFDELKHDCDEKGVPAATCSGKEYVGLTRDPAGALKFALEHIK